MKSQLHFDAEGVPAHANVNRGFRKHLNTLMYRLRKKRDRKLFIPMTDGATLESRAIRAVGPRGFSHKVHLPEPLMIDGREKLVECRSPLKWRRPQVPSDVFGMAAAKVKYAHAKAKKVRKLVGYHPHRVDRQPHCGTADALPPRFEHHDEALHQNQTVSIGGRHSDVGRKAALSK